MIYSTLAIYSILIGSNAGLFNLNFKPQNQQPQSGSQPFNPQANSQQPYSGKYPVSTQANIQQQQNQRSPSQEQIPQNQQPNKGNQPIAQSQYPVNGQGPKPNTQQNQNSSQEGSSSNSQQNQNRSQQTYDYIVVGAGPTGTLTAVLLAMKGYTTLLIDAGSAQINDNVTTPALNFNSIDDDTIGWDFMVKRRGKKSLNYNLPEDDPSNIIRYPRSSGLGGCSLHNAMIHVYPKQQDFIKLVNLTGNRIWSEENFRKYYNLFISPSFIKNLPAVNLLDQVGPAADVKEQISRLAANHTEYNFLPVSQVNFYKLLAPDPKLITLTESLLKDALIRSLFQGGINGYSAGKLTTTNEGSYIVPYNAECNNKGCQRVGPREYALYAAQYYPLFIQPNTLVTEIIIDENKVAQGVKYIEGEYLYSASPLHKPGVKGTPGEAYANKEVIISAGTFNTPQLLMLSGVGDKDELKEMGIPVKVNSPGVGKNLQDRNELTINEAFPQVFDLLKDCKFKTTSDDPCMSEFKKSGTGPYSFNGILTGTLARSNITKIDPDLFVLMAPIYFTGYQKGVAKAVYDNKNFVTFLVMNSEIKNRAGTVKLRSKDPQDMPDINFNWFTDSPHEDINALVTGIKRTRAVAAKLNSDHTEYIPGSKVSTDEQIADYVQKTAWGHHAAGTCKIGANSDPMAVLDDQLRVRGVKNLRVADMSIWPDLPGYFPVLYMYIVGGIAADTIAPQPKDPSWDPSLRVPKAGVVTKVMDGVGLGNLYNSAGGGIITNVFNNLGINGIA
ncbi:FAD/NAD(P)-binding domain-containing protein [Conidiobolus coronatus NRRL 28638]|uniref:FAD/NAD(P)-binding domain-containing protein n=1 Tax=Conidiobolus coronatus (strain ATCC 28846 / CBS 209.66 / NRRL 28638) TaxID=796925 RepID=A0A137NU81_CONC2|nr:FAD/NAD(P)-binding domain-containing protein [Conidiobolus coronatus NRRL 28638]|eukprot:KXN66319.1 FAD/NAD(P)-binding domain-containing protein [Conidiobolus coronatus NRRL 28638]